MAFDIPLEDIVPNRAGGRTAGEPKEIIPVFDEYKQKAIDLMKESIEEAVGRFDKGLLIPKQVTNKETGEVTETFEYTPSGNWRIIGGAKASIKADREAGNLSVMCCIKVGKRNKLPVLPEYKTVDGAVVKVAETGQKEVKVKGSAVTRTLQSFLAVLEGMEKESELGQKFHREAIDIKAKSMASNIKAGKVAYNKLEDKYLPTAPASE